MNLELKYKEETGLPSRKRRTGNYRSYTDEYIIWLTVQAKIDKQFY